MIDRAVAQRYAEAFVNALEASNRIESGLKELKFVAQTYQGSQGLQRFLGSPEIGPEEKQRLLDRLFSDGVGPEGRGLLQLLLRWDRMDHLPAVSEEAILVAEARQGILRGKVITAHPLSAAETEEVAKAMGSRLNRQLVLERQVDPKILGGIRIVAGTYVLDGSIETILKEIKAELEGAKVTG